MSLDVNADIRRAIESSRYHISELDKEEIRDQFEVIRDYLDNEVHPAVSPDRWYIYSNLWDIIDQLEIILEEKHVI